MAGNENARYKQREFDYIMKQAENRVLLDKSFAELMRMVAPDAPENQWLEMRRAFFSGAHETLGLVLYGLDFRAEDQQALIEALSVELENFRFGLGTDEEAARAKASTTKRKDTH